MQRINAGAVVWRVSKRNLEILLVHQSDKPKTLWSIPKGKVDPGETIESAARREVKEETGVKLDTLEFLGYVDYGKFAKRMYTFMGRSPGENAIRAKFPEIDSVGYFPVQEAKKMVDKRQRALINALQKILAFAGSDRDSA